MKRPLVWLSSAFCLGIIIASRIKFSFPLLYLFTLILLLVSFLVAKKGFIFDAVLLCLTCLLGAGLLKNHQTLPECHISNYVRYRNTDLYTIKGFVDTQPVTKEGRTSFVFKAKEIQLGNLRYNCCGNALVYLGGKKPFSYGEELILKGNLCRPGAFDRAKQNNYKNYLYNQGIYFIMRVKPGNTVIRLNRNSGFKPKRFALWLKDKTEETIFKHLPDLPASILDAMVLGEKRNIPALIYSSMIKSGTVHILVVSGFNVGIVAFMITLFLKLIRLPRDIRFCIAIPCLAVYCLMTGASTPVVRATVMSIFFMLGFLFKREPDIYNSCALAAIFILIFNPRQLFDIGFQLSFASVLSIVYLYPRLKALFRTGLIKIRPARFLLEGCLVSFSAWLGTMGFIVYYFKIFSPITVLANLFIVPLATLITLCGFSLIATGLISPLIASLVAHTNELLVALLLNVNAFLIKLPGAYFYLTR